VPAGRGAGGILTWCWPVFVFLIHDERKRGTGSLSEEQLAALASILSQDVLLQQLAGREHPVFTVVRIAMDKSSGTAHIGGYPAVMVQQKRLSGCRTPGC
jgi:hypothetical protein